VWISSREPRYDSRELTRKEGKKGRGPGDASSKTTEGGLGCTESRSAPDPKLLKSILDAMLERCPTPLPEFLMNFLISIQGLTHLELNNLLLNSFRFTCPTKFIKNPLESHQEQPSNSKPSPQELNKTPLLKNEAKPQELKSINLKNTFLDENHMIGVRVNKPITMKLTYLERT